MRIENWLVPGIWFALLLSLGILLYTNARNSALQEGNSFSVRDNDFAVLTVVTDNQRRITINLRKRFTHGEQNLLRAVAAYYNVTPVSAVDLKADTYQLQLPLASCEFSTGLLVYCDSGHANVADKFYGISWNKGNQPILLLTSQQLSSEGLQLSFRTSRERKSVLGTTGQMKSNCMLQAHLKIAVYKNTGTERQYDGGRCLF